MTRAVSSSSAPAKTEEIFWRGVGVHWSHLAGDIHAQGFSFEWHHSDAGEDFDWSNSFHPRSVEICLNLEGNGHVRAGELHADFAGETAGFFASNGGDIQAVRFGSGKHRFLSIEFAVEFLRENLPPNSEDLHPLIRRCLQSEPPTAGVSEVTPMTQRRRDLLRALLHPPVLRAAQPLWFRGKALEFSAEFFFTAAQEPLCTRAQRVAQERVAKAKEVLLDDLENSLPLEELGRRVGCSPFYLSRTFTRETGTTISQWLRAARLERAAKLLRERTCNVTEAALRVGYSSLSHFSQAFREEFGCCPGLYPLQTQTQRGSAEVNKDTRVAAARDERRTLPTGPRQN